jgi:CRP/FNR family transcriptional regulator
MPNLDQLPPPLKEFFDNATRLKYGKGQIIIRPEDEPSGVFYIQSGYVKTYSINKYGSENLHLIRKSGEIFPLIWAFTDEIREVYYEAVVDSDLLRVSRSEFLKFVDDNPKVMRYVLDQAIEMYRIHSERLYNLQFQTAQERVIYALITLADRFGEDHSAGIKIMVPLKHSDIAASLKMTRETATRILSKLEKRGLIGYEKPYLVIRDLEALRKLL